MSNNSVLPIVSESESLRGHRPRLRFSCVVDNDITFKQQAVRWIWSLINSGNATGSDIVVHAIDSQTDQAFLEILKRYGVHIQHIERFGSGVQAYCNKLMQLSSPILRDCDCIVLCDTDLAFVADIRDRVHPATISARIVDGANPSITSLRQLYAVSGLRAAAKETTTGFTREPTFELNCNGGLYIMAPHWLDQLAPAWIHWSRFVLAQTSLPLDQRKHADQIGFCFAMLELGLSFEPLSVDWNFPTHLPGKMYKSMHFPDVKVLHYHRNMTIDGQLQPTGASSIDHAIDSVNTLFQKENSTLLATVPTARDIMGAPFAGTPRTKRKSITMHLRYRLHTLLERFKRRRYLTSEQILANGMTICPYPELFTQLLDLSVKELGFYPQTAGRTIEYPWVAQKAGDVHGLNILDVGAGVNVLPLWFASHGARVHTIDNHPMVRSSQNKPSWNEWGFLDYALLAPEIKSYHSDIADTDFPCSFDLIYSVSVIEHIPYGRRRVIIKRLAQMTRPAGKLILTLDLIPESRNLWNLSSSETVDPADLHGSIDTVASELSEAGFHVDECNVSTRIPGSRCDLGFIVAVMNRSSI